MNYVKLFESLPESVQDALLSTEVANAIYNLGRSINFNDKQISSLGDLVGDIIMGVEKESDLRAKLQQIGSSDALLEQPVIKILDSIHHGRNKPQVPDRNIVIATLANAASEITATESTSQEPVIGQKLKPSFKEPVTTSSSPKAEAAPGEIIHPAPFILHEEKPIEGTGDLHQNFSIQRPSFYKPVFSSEEPRFDAYAKPKAATIELGGGEVKKPLPASLKTSPQQVRVVHYSEFKTNVDPFGAQPTISANPVPAATPAISSNPVAAPTPQVPPPIHSNNVVDLKDLPLE